MIKQRDTFFDSLKFSLMFLVVLGHTIEVLMFKGENGIFMRDTYMLIYTFHMPLFIFISGYFSKNVNIASFWKGLPNLIIPYLIFQFILLAPQIIAGKFDIMGFLFMPKWGMWYILSLIFWRFFASLLNTFKIKIGILLILISVVISLLVGFTSLSTAYLSISRTFVFLPFFLLGMYCTPEKIGRIRAINKIIPISIIVAITAAVVFFLGSRTAFQFSLWGIMPYNEYSSWMLGVTLRVLMLIIAAIMSFSMLNLSGNTFARLGNNTLAIYLLHMPIIYIGFDALVKHLGFKVGLAGSIFVTIVVIAICIALSKLRIIQFLLNPIDKRNKSK